jgi:flagellar basal body rod protein FlgC
MYMYLACAYAKKGDAKKMNDCLLQMKRLGVHRPLGYIINYGVPKNVDILDIVETNVHFQSEFKPDPPQNNNKFVSDSAVKKIEELLSFP